jgi:hypothetical protein
MSHDLGMVDHVTLTIAHGCFGELFCVKALFFSEQWLHQNYLMSHSKVKEVKFIEACSL